MSDETDRQMCQMYEKFFRTPGSLGKAEFARVRERIASRMSECLSTQKEKSAVPPCDLAAYPRLLAAQALVARRRPELPWESERVYRVVAQIGRGRRLFSRPKENTVFSYAEMIDRIAFNPDAVEEKDEVELASIFVWVATQVVYEEVKRERLLLSAAESWMVSVLNNRARYQDLLLARALGSYNQALWKGAGIGLRSLSPDESDCFRAIAGDPIAVWRLAEYYDLVVRDRLQEEGPGPFDFALCGLHGDWLGQRLPLEELAPGLFKPLIAALVVGGFSEEPAFSETARMRMSSNGMIAF